MIGFQFGFIVSTYGLVMVVLFRLGDIQQILERCPT